MAALNLHSEETEKAEEELHCDALNAEKQGNSGIILVKNSAGKIL